VGYRSLLQRIFQTQDLNPGSPELLADSLPSEPPGKPTSGGTDRKQGFTEGFVGVRGRGLQSISEKMERPKKSPSSKSSPDFHFFQKLLILSLLPLYQHSPVKLISVCTLLLQTPQLAYPAINTKAS